MSVLIRDVLLNRKEVDIYIEDGHIVEIGTLNLEADHVIDGTHKAVLPGLINAHTHAAMTLFRSYADDMPLHEWLRTKIWPLEAKLDGEDIYWGTRLACIEMIKGGTTCFNDMYYFIDQAARAVHDSGIRAVLSSVYFDMLDPTQTEEGLKRMEREVRSVKIISERVQVALGPHAPYTVSDEALAGIADLAQKLDVLIHFHLAETKEEVEAYRERTGKDLVPALNEIGLLSDRLVAAHCVHLSDRDIEILASRGVSAVHCPVSNMKLTVGAVLRYKEMRSKGLNVALGTDGCASNNNLDMFESMKFAALLQKFAISDQTVLSATEVFDMATICGAKALRLDAGRVEEGLLADLIIVDLKRPELTPGHRLINDLVYSASGSVVDTTICDGRVLMTDGRVKGEEEVLEMARKRALDLVYRAMG